MLNNNGLCFFVQKKRREKVDGEYGGIASAM